MSINGRAWLALTLVSSAILVGGQSLGGRTGLLWGLALALTLNAVISFFGDWFLAPRTKGQIIKGNDPWQILKQVKELSQKMRTPAPIIITLPSEAPQAYIFTGLLGAPRLVVTKGLLHSLDPAELRAVLAYLLALKKRHNSLGLTMAAGVAAILLGASQMVDKVLAWLLGGKKSSSVRHLCSGAVAPLLSLALKLQVRQTDFLDADKEAIQFLDSPKDLALALWKLEAYRLTKPFSSPPFLAPLFIVSPISKKDWTRFFSLQPRVQKRIEKIVGHYPV